MENVVKTTVYLTDLSKFQEMNDVYARYFNEPFPARASSPDGEFATKTSSLCRLRGPRRR